METLTLAPRGLVQVGCTDPTYKEWKLPQLLGVMLVCLPGTDPTYKEWKRVTSAIALVNSWLHGSYLQGMETGGWQQEV